MNSQRIKTLKDFDGYADYCEYLRQEMLAKPSDENLQILYHENLEVWGTLLLAQQELFSKTEQSGKA